MDSKVHEFNPSRLIGNILANNGSEERVALLILNYSLEKLDYKIFKRLWDNCKIRLCADGAGNRLFKYGDLNNCLERNLPTAIVGDLDSLNEESHDYYSGKV
ncbi:Thiamine pyrophosphokinase [Smittium culicis]|uniref:Thiamine pyrophosphokinase n=1 Tax=Smittium culicis TaxID=133412 RepID=A0A1R1WZ95_9FUNG|nr:Thiamine pyrophosphokinase [Smittium culicis]